MNTLVATDIAALPASGAGGLKFQVGRVLRGTWRVLERVGQARAAAELSRRAEHYRGIDAERAAWLARLAADCRRGPSPL